MMESLKNGLRGEPPHPLTLSLEERAVSEEQKGVLEHLRDKVGKLRTHIWQAYPIPTYEAARDVTERMDKGLLHIAQLAREFGVHHKNYHVGALVLGTRMPTEDDPNPWTIMFDANTKLDREGRATPEGGKWCAELNLFDRAEGKGPAGEEEKMREIYSMIIAAEPRKMEEDPVGLMDDISRRKQITLTCCALCRARMLKMTSRKNGTRILSENTEVVTARIDSGENMPLRKYQHVKDLPPFHGEPLPDDVEEMD